MTTLPHDDTPPWCRPNPTEPQHKLRQQRNPLFDPEEDAMLYVGIDHGTKFSSMCWGIRGRPKGDEAQDLLQPDDWACINHESRKIPMEVGLFHDGNHFQMYIGSDLEYARKIGIVQEIDIVEGVKLAMLFNERRFGSEEMQEGLELMEGKLDSIFNLLGGWPQNVSIRLPFRQFTYTQMVKSARDILYLSQLYLVSLLKENLRRRNGYSYAEVDFIFAEKTVIGISVPSCWPNTVIDKYSMLWQDAGLRPNTIILSEAKSAAAFSVYRSLRMSKNKYQRSAVDDSCERLENLSSTLTILSDTGGSTTDVASVAIAVSSTARLPRFVELVDSVGSLSGSFCLTQKFRSRLQKKKNTQYLDSLHEKSGQAPVDVLNAICAAFDDLKTVAAPGEGMNMFFTLPKLPGYLPDEIYSPLHKLALTRLVMPLLRGMQPTNSKQSASDQSLGCMVPGYLSTCGASSPSTGWRY